MFQEKLLDYLQEEISEKASLIEAVATALDISYDASYRRVSLKSKFSLDETILLAKYYNLSLDRLYETVSTNFLSIEKTKRIESEQELQLYFEESYESLVHLLKQKECEILYSAKDIPLFYTISGNILSDFKIYVWLKLLDPKFVNKSFESYTPSLSLIQAGKKLADLYNNLNITEIWDITTVNSTLKQVHYYYQAGQISTTNALEMCTLLKQLIDKIASKLTSKEVSFQLYYNELHLMNNNVLVTTPASQLLYIPFTLLSYYKTSDKLTCKEAQTFLDKQLQNSKLLNTTGEKERNQFFNKIHTKIDALQQLIKASVVLDFE